MMTIEEHYNAIAPRLTNWLVATGSSYAAACDLVQDTFAKIWKMRDDLRDSDSAVSGLAFTIARNLRKNAIRDDRHLVFSDELPETAETAAAPSGTSPSDLDYLRGRLQKAFAALPPTLCEAYTLFQIQQMSVREIALQTGVSENLVKVRIHRAKEKLKPLLADLRVTF
jgi:RNA polymerase sigma-70 factor (ECF subfamily)